MLHQLSVRTAMKAFQLAQRLPSNWVLRAASGQKQGSSRGPLAWLHWTSRRPFSENPDGPPPKGNAQPRRGCEQALAC